MSDEVEVSAEDPTVEAEAREQGWSPKDQWRGPADQWIPASKYLERGREIMPILRKNNQRLEASQASLKSQVGELTDTVKAAHETIEALKTFQDEMLKQKVKEAETRIRRELREARKDGDDDRVADLEEELDEVKEQKREAEKVAEKKPVAAVATKPQGEPPEFAAWKSRNEWFGTDPRRTGYAMGVAKEIEAQRPELKGEAFFTEVDKEMNKVFGRKEEPTPSKVNGSGGGAGGGRAGKGKSYEDLPAEAKASCDKYSKTLVGDKRAYKTVEDWRKKFTDDYFKEV